jgi:hypothetical protein
MSRATISTAHTSTVVLGLTALVLSASACRPFAEIGQSCVDAPCGAGLVCDEGICKLDPPPAPPPPPPPPPCESDDACTVNGSADGRACVGGDCIWIDCTFDGECGTRLCDLGQCAERRVCLGDEDCKDGGLCVDGSCRTPCVDDAQCGGFLQTCLAGRCEQTCFLDLMCFGDICEDGICAPPACAVDDDCGMNQACTDGRCESYDPCLIDEDCTILDPGYFCNDQNRCEALPACVLDSDCAGIAICRANVCQETEACLVDTDCSDAGDECVAGRCVTEPACRSDDDCAATSACVNTVCAPFVPTAASDIVVETAHGPCFTDGTGACAVVMFPGETATVRVTPFNDAGEPVRSTLAFSPLSALFLDVEPVEGGALLEALAPGLTALVVEDQGGALVTGSLKVTVLPAQAGEALRVLVVDAETGEEIPGAAVAAGADSAVTGANGLALFVTAPALDALSTSAIVVDATGYRGEAVLDHPLTGDVRVALRALVSEPVAALTARSLSSGDETGPVGTGIVLGSAADVASGSMESLFLPAFPGALEVPLFGALDVPLPRPVTLEATIPLIGSAQTVRDLAYVTTTGGYPLATAWEARGETDQIFSIIFGGTTDAIAFALDLARRSESFDVRTVALGRTDPAPLVSDDTDLDGDGDVLELVPDFFARPTVDITPEQLPRERVGLDVPPPPSSARAEVFVMLGLELAGTGVTPTGIGALSGTGGEQVKVVPPASAGLAAAQRIVRAEAVFDDGGTAVVWSRNPAFSTTMSLPAFLARPDGAFVLTDVPSVGATSIVLPESAGATTFAVRINTVLGERLLIAPSGPNGAGRTLVLPAAVAQGGGIFILDVTALTLPGPDAVSATLATTASGEGPFGSLESRSSAFSRTSPR